MQMEDLIRLWPRGLVIFASMSYLLVSQSSEPPCCRRHSSHYCSATLADTISLTWSPPSHDATHVNILTSARDRRSPSTIWRACILVSSSSPNGSGYWHRDKMWGWDARRELQVWALHCFLIRATNLCSLIKTLLNSKFPTRRLHRHLMINAKAVFCYVINML